MGDVETDTPDEAVYSTDYYVYSLVGLLCFGAVLIIGGPWIYAGMSISLIGVGMVVTSRAADEAGFPPTQAHAVYTAWFGMTISVTGVLVSWYGSWQNQNRD